MDRPSAHVLPRWSRADEAARGRKPEQRRRRGQRDDESKVANASGHDLVMASDNRFKTCVRSIFSLIADTHGSRPMLCIRSIAVLIVNFLGSSVSFTSSHTSGIETVAPGRGRTLKGATMVCP